VTPKPTVKSTEIEKVQAQVLAEVDDEELEEPTVVVQLPPTEIENIVVTTQPTYSPTSEAQGQAGISHFLMWGGVFSMMGAIGSFLWISNKN
jgi:hypothetical protein